MLRVSPPRNLAKIFRLKYWRKTPAQVFFEYRAFDSFYLALPLLQIRCVKCHEPTLLEQATMARNLMRLRCLFFLFAAVTFIGCGMTDEEDVSFDGLPLEGHSGPEFEQRRSELSNFCSVRVDGYGTLNVEEEYLAQIVTCEHAGAPLETLKAQAIAARGYAKYVVDVERRPLSPTTRDQAYNCGRAPTADARRAVRETSGMVLTHNGKIFMPFYVAGSTNVNTNTCHARDNAGTQKYVTYNEGRTGASVQGSPLGWIGSPANRGAMSQNGSACLARKGWKAERILRFWYGDDMRVHKLGGSCVHADTDPDLGGGGGVTPDEGDTCEDSGGGASSSRPTIISRSQWGARAPRFNRTAHTPNRITIHHTVTANNPRDGKAAARLIQNMHMNGNGWSDVGYHFMIDQKGNIYAGNPVDRMGAHVANGNTGNVGISFLGQFHAPYQAIPAIQPSQASLKAAGQLVGWLADKYNINISTSTVMGHSDQNNTACPGTNLYSKLGQIRDYGRNGTGGGGESCEPGDGPTEFKHIRVRHVSDNPSGHNDTIEGFEVDSVFGQSANGNTNYFAQSTSTTGTVSNANAVKGAPDNDSCDNRSSKVAGVESGGALIATLGTALKAGDKVRVVQANYHTGMNDCAPSGTAEIAVSADKINWIVLGEVSGNTTLTVKKSYIQFSKPLDSASTGHSVDFAVTASSDITRVDYLADGWKMGSSSSGPSFAFNYNIQYAGVREIQARGYNASGNLVATDKISIKVANGSTLKITTPTNGSRSNPNVSFKASASSDITRVEYLADDWSMGSTRQGPDFAFSYPFQYTGLRAIEARGYNAAGKHVASHKIKITVARGGSSLDIISPLDGSNNGRDVTFKARASSDIVKVEYRADDWPMGNSTSRSSSFSFNYDFDYTGVRAIEARGYNSAGSVVAVDRVSIRVRDNQASLTFTSPTNGSTHGHQLQFAVRTTGNIVKVEYFADDWSLGSSSNTSTFPHSYNIQYAGVRRLEARGYNAAGNIVATDRITVTVKSSGGGTDSAMANALAREGGTCSGVGNGGGGPRCSNGRGGYSTGSCWAYVKAAMIRAGLATRADIDRLASRVGMTPYSVQISAAGFKRAADRASASVLRDTMGLKKVHMPVGQAPAGAIINWAAGCRGAHSQYGHIEIAMGDGYACSDYCGRLRADATCASVFVAVD